MVRFAFKCILVCLVMYALIVYAAYLHTGRLWLPTYSLPSISWFTSSPKLEPVGAPDEPTWRWRQNGRWHYGDTPPAGVKAERIDRTAVNNKNQGADK